MYDYNFITYQGEVYNADNFFETYPKCTIKQVVDLQTEDIKIDGKEVKYKLFGVYRTKMGELQVFNKSKLGN